MALALQLTKAGHIPVSIRTVAKVRIERSNDGFAITHIELATQGEVPGLDADAFLAQAETAKISCPVSKALSGVEISLTAKLVEGSSSALLLAGADPAPRAEVIGRK
jgi:osmotically inducible protein OsmC